MSDDLDLRALDQRHEPDPAFRRSLREQVIATLAAPATIHEPELLEAIVLTEERPDTHVARRRRTALAVAAVIVVIAAAAVGAVVLAGDDDGSDVAAVHQAVFDDRFDDASGNWQDDPDVTIDGGVQSWTITIPGQSVILRPQAMTEPLVDTEVRAEVAAIDQGSRAGVLCRKGTSEQDHYYFFRIGPEGAMIGVLPPDTAGSSPVPGESLATDTAVVPPATPFTITAQCIDTGGETQLTMLIDGEIVLEASTDISLPGGFGALEVQAGGQGSAPSDVRWDRFTVDAPQP